MLTNSMQSVQHTNPVHVAKTRHPKTATNKEDKSNIALRLEENPKSKHRLVSYK